MTKNIFAVAMASLFLVSTSIGSANAFQSRYMNYSDDRGVAAAQPTWRSGQALPSGQTWPGSQDGIGGMTRASCPMNSASEGNANQQNFPVKQYGQTTGGNRC